MAEEFRIAAKKRALPIRKNAPPSGTAIKVPRGTHEGLAAQGGICRRSVRSREKAVRWRL